MDASQLRKSGAVTETGRGAWRLELGAGPAGEYRLAQLDDYSHLRRGNFPHTPPAGMRLEARASAQGLPGTWGFGMWNDPFSAGMGLGGGVRHLPSRPQAAWFFFASGENHLALDDNLPGNGATASTFRAESSTWPMLLPGALLLPMMLWRGGSRRLRGMGRRVVAQDAVQLEVSENEWNGYELMWEEKRVTFKVNGGTVLETGVSPRGRLGLVLWLDNQYAAWRPDGSWGFGALANEQAAWVELRGFAMEG